MSKSSVDWINVVVNVVSDLIEGVMRYGLRKQDACEIVLKASQLTNCFSK